MSLSAVNSTLSSLKTCQTDIGTGMDIVTNVAMDLIETQGAEDNAGLKKLEVMMLECAKLDREINCFVGVVEQITAEVRQQPEAMFGLKARVKDQFTEMMDSLSDTDLQNHTKVIAFKESIRDSLKQDENMEEVLDEDIAVTQSEVDFTCPLTRLEMVNPVKNKKCNHQYDHEAILGVIQARHSQKKKCRCPVVGCGNKDVMPVDLVLDQTMKRRIQNHKRQTAKNTNPPQGC